MVPWDWGLAEGAQPYMEHVQQQGQRDEDLQGCEDLQGIWWCVSIYTCIVGRSFPLISRG